MSDVEPELKYLSEQVGLKRLIPSKYFRGENWSSFELWSIFGDELEKLIQTRFSSEKLNDGGLHETLLERLTVVEKTLSLASTRARETLQYSVVEKFITGDEGVDNKLQEILLSNTTECYAQALTEFRATEQWKDESGKFVKY